MTGKIVVTSYFFIIFETFLLQAFDKNILLVGGKIDGETSATTNIFEYETDSSKWDIRSEQLIEGRHENVAFLVPDSYCKE